ncbi:MAG TPA: PhzF family phenazine biosynthesis protein [Gammaproteobacteria bacterium]|nr:PhzF family phenazine biosynthesis protein [Gammaproteobacteria bacterium]
MKIELYQIDAFAKTIFEGNPAAVCPLKQWLDDATLQSIAKENNLSETAFFIPSSEGFHIRWFTPSTEVNLCGHATLAAAFVIFNELGYKQEQISFASRSGVLNVTRDQELLIMDFPAQPAVPCELPEEIKQAIDVQPIACLKSEDYIVVLNNENEVLNANPRLEFLKNIDLRGVILTARSENFDFVSRFFAPKYGIDEDPVTGSSYTQLIPYWATQMNKNKLHCKQVSQRGGEVFCELHNDRVSIAGYAVKYLQGHIEI